MPFKFLKQCAHGFGARFRPAEAQGFWVSSILVFIFRSVPSLRVVPPPSSPSTVYDVLRSCSAVYTTNELIHMAIGLRSCRSRSLFYHQHAGVLTRANARPFFRVRWLNSRLGLHGVLFTSLVGFLKKRS